MIIRLFSLVVAATVLPVSAEPSRDIAPFVQEASDRTGVPVAVIWAVIGTESAGELRATSPKGAAGLMQLMPKTWSMLRNELGLGADIFDPHDNIIAGTYYLRYLYDQYGWEGMFAAYNAGPGRYESHRDRGQALPVETHAYVSRISEKLSGKRYVFKPNTSTAISIPWTEAALFIASPDGVVTPTPGLTTTMTPFVALPPNTNQSAQ